MASKIWYCPAARVTAVEVLQTAGTPGEVDDVLPQATRTAVAAAAEYRAGRRMSTGSGKRLRMV
jgi:hypothetical protein